MVSLLVCAGCASASPFATGTTRRNLQQLEIGMPKEEVIKIEGSPYGREAFQDQDGEPIEFLLYQTQFVGMAISPSDTELTPVALKNGKVIGWGRNFYDQAKQYRIEQEVTFR